MTYNRTNSAAAFLNFVVICRKDYDKLRKGEKVENFSIAGHPLYEEDFDTAKASCLPRKLVKATHNLAVSSIEKAQQSQNGWIVLPCDKHPSFEALMESLDLMLVPVIRDANHETEVESEDDIEF